MIALRRLSDGAVLAGVRAPGATASGTICGPMGYAQSAPHVFPFFKSDGGSQTGASIMGTIVAGLASGNRLVWSPAVPNSPVPQTSVFENDLGWGMGFEGGTLRVMFPAESGPFTTIDQGAIYPAHSGVGRRNLVISNPAMSGNQDEVIRAWEPDRPSRTIVAQSDTTIPAVALSETTMVWVGVHGPRRWDGTYTAAELYWTSFPAGVDPVPVTGGTPLVSVAGTVEVQTWGDYAAVMSADPIKRRLVATVVRLSDGKQWTINPRPGASFVRLLAVSPREVVVAENDDSGDPALVWQMQYLTRYDLARLDELAAAW